MWLLFDGQCCGLPGGNSGPCDCVTVNVVDCRNKRASCVDSTWMSSVMGPLGTERVMWYELTVALISFDTVQYHAISARPAMKVPLVPLSFRYSEISA